MKNKGIIVDVEKETVTSPSEKKQNRRHNYNYDNNSLPKFETYSNKKLKKVYKEYEFSNKIPTYEDNDFERIQKINKDYAPTKESLVYKKKIVKEKVPFNLTKKSKLALVTCAIVFTLMSGIAVFNAVKINNLEKEYLIKQNQYLEKDADARKLANLVDNLTDKEKLEQNADKNQYEEIGKPIDVKEYKVKKVRLYDKKGNFFDNIADFFRKLFSL